MNQTVEADIWRLVQLSKYIFISLLYARLNVQSNNLFLPQKLSSISVIWN